MDEFARAEAAVSEALLLLSEVPGRGEAVSLPHLVGQRFAALGELVSENGAFAVEGKGVAKSLAEWSAHHTFRSLLCHGMATVTVDHRGRWHLVLKMLTFRSGEAVRESMVIDEEEAAERLTALHASPTRSRPNSWHSPQRRRRHCSSGHNHSRHRGRHRRHSR